MLWSGRGRDYRRRQDGRVVGGHHTPKEKTPALTSARAGPTTRSTSDRWTSWQNSRLPTRSKLHRHTLVWHKSLLRWAASSLSEKVARRSRAAILPGRV